MKQKNRFFRVFAGLLFLAVVLAMPGTAGKVLAGAGLTYEFKGDGKDKAGYAEGTITISSDEKAVYHLFWSDDQGALKGYYEIDSKLEEEKNCRLSGKTFGGKGFSVEAGKTVQFSFHNHTAIPGGATKLIAVKDASDPSVAGAAAVYDIPKEKQLQSRSGKLLYTFNSYSDIHIDKDGFYKNAEKNWAQALKYAADMDSDFIVTSGDSITNANSDMYEPEYKTYAKILKESPYTGNVWECNGNHDMRSGGKDSTGTYYGNLTFARVTGTDSTAAGYKSKTPYYYMIEPNTGDLFIFMALEEWPDKESNRFSDKEMEWLQDLLDTYYGTGVNIYVIEHATIKNFSTGDNWDNKLYGGHMEEARASGLKAIFEKYKDLIWMNGHSHQDYYLEQNYSNRNGEACHMIHNPAVAGTTYYNNKDSSQEYDSPEIYKEKGSSGSDGKGLNSQGYFVEVYENEVVFCGADLKGEAIYPEYCYIMEGSRDSEEIQAVRTHTIQPEYESYKADKELVAEDAGLEEVQKAADTMLDTYGAYASFDQYQAVKRLRYSIPGIQAFELKNGCEMLYGFMLAIGVEKPSSPSAPVVTGGTRYFQNKLWDKVYVYLYNSSSDKNAEWPGVKMTEVAGKSSKGYDIYQFDTENYANVIFNDGGNGNQTIDIELSAYSENCFYVDIDNVTKKSGKNVYGVGNYSFGK